MEPAGVALGIIGLAGLFSSCIELVQKVQLYKSFRSDSSILDVQLRAEKLRLEHWGRSVGLAQANTNGGGGGSTSVSMQKAPPHSHDDKKIEANFFDASKHTHQHPALQDAETLSTAWDILSIIRHVLEEEDAANTSKDPSQPTPIRRTGSGLSKDPLLPFGGATSDSKRRKLTWALWGKGERTDRVKLIGMLVQQLHNLVPVQGGGAVVEAEKEKDEPPVYSQELGPSEQGKSVFQRVRIILY